MNRLKLADLKKNNKLHAQRTVVDDIIFPSKKEANRYLELKYLRMGGKIKWFIRQPTFDLPGGTRARADFLIVWDDGHITIEDAKGYKTDSYIRNKKQIEALYPIKIEEV